MHTLIAKYILAFHEEKGSPTDKVKKILMCNAHMWDWINSETTVADLIDDCNITADDIVDFLSSVYETEGGNEEFHYAVRALQICLRKAHLAEASHHNHEEIEDIKETEEASDYESDLYLSKNIDNLHRIKY